jgi:hypothetical protein
MLTGSPIIVPIGDFWHRTRILATYPDLTLIGTTKMPDAEWIKTLEDGRKVKFIYQELPEDGAFITAPACA